VTQRNHFDDDDHDDDLKSQARPSGILSTLRGVAWIVAASLTLLVGFFGCGSLVRTNNAIQEASIAAITAAVLVGIYTLARSVTSVLSELEDSGRKGKSLRRRVRQS